jgi:hypothetical protein
MEEPDNTIIIAASGGATFIAALCVAVGLVVSRRRKTTKGKGPRESVKTERIRARTLSQQNKHTVVPISDYSKVLANGYYLDEQDEFYQRDIDEIPEYQQVPDYALFMEAKNQGGILGPYEEADDPTLQADKLRMEGLINQRMIKVYCLITNHPRTGK